MTKIDWDKAPDWVNWWAMDANGVCFFYEKQPFAQVLFNWWTSYGNSCIDENSETYNLSEIDWRNSLTRRPAA